MALDETPRQEIVRRILTVAEPDRVILFGSAATGQMTRDSDIPRTSADKCSMKLPDEVRRELVRQWIGKAEQDLAAAEILLKDATAYHLSLPSARSTQLKNI